MRALKLIAWIYTPVAVAWLWAGLSFEEVLQLSILGVLIWIYNEMPERDE